MMRPRLLGLPLAASVWFVVLLLLPWTTPAQEAEPSTKRSQGTPGQFFTLEQPLTSDIASQLMASTRAYVQSQASQGNQPILIFEIRPGQSTFGSVLDLMDFIAHKLRAARKTVAFVPEPLSGYGVLLALACDEIVMGEQASLGPITPPGEEVNRSLIELVGPLATSKGRDADLAIGMLDRSANLRKVLTADGQTQYVLAENLEELEESKRIVEDRPAWDAGARGILTARRARDEGLIRFLAENRADVARVYNLSRTSDDPILGQGEIRAVWIKVEGLIDSTQEAYLKRRVAQARRDRVNLIFFQFDTEGGLDGPADNTAELIANIRDMKTVAYINDRALGVSTLPALACDEIVFHRGGSLGNVHQVITGRNRVEALSERKIQVLADRAEDIARRNGYPVAVARAMVDPSTTVVEALDRQAGAVVLMQAREVREDPNRFEERGTLKGRNDRVLTVVADDASTFRLSNHPVVSSTEEFKDIFGLRGRMIRMDGPTWVDALVTTLNTPWMSGLLLFVGLFMLILEMKLPGIGLPAITATLAFLLFFWSRYLGGTADSLEIILFLVGLICLALELFVFPGFGVFGMSGVVLVLVSVVMASHTFIWPTQDSEFLELQTTLIQVVLALLGVLIGAILIGRYFPSMPLFNRFVLRPELFNEAPMEDPTAKPAPDADAPLLFLLGETGRTTSVLRPTGKARFGELLVDVTADGFYIEPNSLVQVVEIHGSRVIVKKV